MELELLEHNWNLLGEEDPMWAILMTPEYRGNRWDKQDFFRTGQHDIRNAMDKILDLRFPLRRGKALDFGCGLGRLTQALACYFDEATGVDISTAMIRGARDYNPYGARCQFVVNQRDDLAQFGDNQFDFVLSLLVLQHMRPDYIKKYVAEFVRILAPGGLVLFQQPSERLEQPITQEYRPLSYRVRNRARRLMRRTQNRLDKWIHLDRQRGYDYATIVRPIHAVRGPVIRRDPASDLAPPMAESCSNKPEPKTEIHTIKRSEMIAHIKNAGGHLLHIEPRNECSPIHMSYRYFVTKR